MNNNNKYAIGEFSEKTGLSIRSLHYYDEIGVLQPERDTSSGHRIYSYQDLITLQKIMNLKFLGYSLEEIARMLHEPSFNSDLTETLTLHVNQLEKNKANIEKSITAIQKVMKLIEEEGEVDSSILFNLVQYMQTEPAQKEWMGKNQLTDWAEYLSHKSEDEKSALYLSTVQVYKEIKQLYSTSIEKPEVQALVQKYLEVSLAYSGPEIIESFSERNVETLDFTEIKEMVPSPLTEEEEEWLNHALIYYMKQVNGDWRSKL